MAELWRYRCPQGHSCWTRSPWGTYYCKPCGKTFDRLKDVKTGHFVDSIESD